MRVTASVLKILRKRAPEGIRAIPGHPDEVKLLMSIASDITIQTLRGMVKESAAMHKYRGKVAPYWGPFN